MLSNFDRKTLAAINSIRMAMPADFEVLVQGLKSQEDYLSEHNRTCKDEITLRWNQGGLQALDSLIYQMETAGTVLRKEHENEDERKRTAAVKGRAIG